MILAVGVAGLASAGQAVADDGAPPAYTGVAITGIAQQGQTLTISTSWPTPASTDTYQWADCDGSGQNCTPIEDATGQTYTLTGSDVGHTIDVLVQVVDGDSTGTTHLGPTAVVVPHGRTTSGCPPSRRAGPEP